MGIGTAWLRQHKEVIQALELCGSAFKSQLFCFSALSLWWVYLTSLSLSFLVYKTEPCYWYLLVTMKIHNHCKVLAQYLVHSKCTDMALLEMLQEPSLYVQGDSWSPLEGTQEHFWRDRAGSGLLTPAPDSCRATPK